MLTSFLAVKSIARNVNALLKHFQKEKTDTRQQEIKKLTNQSNSLEKPVAALLLSNSE